MKLPRTFPEESRAWPRWRRLLALALLAGCKKAAKPAPPAAPKPAAGTSTPMRRRGGQPPGTEFVSVFDDSPPPGNKGRDPFNPDSTSRNPAACRAEVNRSQRPGGPPVEALQRHRLDPGRLAGPYQQPILDAHRIRPPPSASLAAPSRSKSSGLARTMLTLRLTTAPPKPD